MYQPLGFHNMVLAAVIGVVSGIVGTLGIKAYFAFKKYQKKEKEAHAAPGTAQRAPAAPHHQAGPPPTPSRETWEKYGYGPAIVGAEMIGGFSGRWPPLAEMGKIGNLMTWAIGIGYGAVYGIAITPWIREPIAAFVLFYVVVMAADYGLLVPWGIFKPPWKEGHAFYFNLVLYGIYCVLTVIAFYWITRLFF